MVENIINTTIMSVDIEQESAAKCLLDATKEFLLAPLTLTAEEMSSAILKMSRSIVSLHNANLDKSQAALKWSMPSEISPQQTALCMIKLNNAISLLYDETKDVIQDGDVDIAVYDEERGLYNTNPSAIDRVIYSYNPSFKESDVKEVVRKIKAWAPVKTRNSDRDLIPVNNGIYNYKTKQLLPFDPDMVFVTKSRTNYNPNAQNVVIHNDEDGTDWDVESWMDDLTDDPEITNLLWEITGALLRPNVVWNKSAWLYSDKGENGKGTLCAMWRNLCGSAATSIPIASFSKQFMLTSLITSQAIIVDENDVGAFIEKAAELKAVITNDTIMIDRKFQHAISYRFRGFMVQCLNELPRFKDKSNSIYRRQLFIPMSKCFTGKARRYIKDDYINRPEVLEYVMKRVFEMDYYVLSEPEACKLVLEEYKTFNDPVRQFWTEFEEQFTWDLLPNTFLYDLFKEWFKRDNPSGSIMGRNTFLKDLYNIIDACDSWSPTMEGTVQGKERVGNRMDKTETLIAKYNLEVWMTPGMNSKSAATVDAMCRPIIADRYKGLKRV